MADAGKKVRPQHGRAVTEDWKEAGRQCSVTILYVALTAALCCHTAFADEISDATASFQDWINRTYLTVRNVSLTAGAVSLGFCGIVLMTGSQKNTEKVITAIKYILMAIAGVFLIPAVVRFGRNMFGSHGWDPTLLR